FCSLLCAALCPRPLCSPLFPYTTLFRSQGYSYRRFTESLRLLADRSVFFGLRNHGSIERVRALLPGDLAERVVYQPCPTTVARQDRKSTRLNSSHVKISYAVFCLKKKNT